MKILHVGNHVRQKRCGIANFGYQFSEAFRRAGYDVTDWDAEYSVIYDKIQKGEPSYMPGNVADYDVVHFNWHPITTNHYITDHFHEARFVSVYLNDTPDHSSCPFFDRADVKVTAEPYAGCVEIPYPIADWVTDFPPPTPHFSLGVATVRGDGVEKVRQIAKTHGWEVIEPDHSIWLPFEDAVRHQARATVNVQWYHEGRGKSGGASQALASLRPVLMNDSPMFSHYHDYKDEIYFRTDLPAALGAIEMDWQQGLLTVPDRVIRERGWLSWGVPAFVHAWEAAGARVTR